MDEFEDSFEYSDDGLYRWWYERRWADGPGLCWIGLNPSTGDTTGRPRPTLRKVVTRAKAAGLSAVTVVQPVLVARHKARKPPTRTQP